MLFLHIPQIFDKSDSNKVSRFSSGDVMEASSCAEAPAISSIVHFPMQDSARSFADALIVATTLPFAYEQRNRYTDNL